MSNVLVTGANGFLGANLCRSLIEKGHHVKALVRKTSDLSELRGLDVEYVYGDVTDEDSIRKNLNSIETVFHLAGYIAYKKSERALMDKVNVDGTRNIVQAVGQSQVKKLIHLSSVVAVGAGFSDKQILNEESRFNLSHLNLGYFETKKKAEEIIVQAARENKIQATMLNPSTIYGAGDFRKGSRKTQLKVAQGKFKFYTRGGVSIVAVEDVVDAILNSVELGQNGERYILSGENMTIQQLFELIAEVAGVKPPTILMPDTVLHTLGFVGDTLAQFGVNKGMSRENAYTATLYHWFSHKKATRELNFQPRPARFAIENSVNWLKTRDASATPI